jgi:hypothetical protein
MKLDRIGDVGYRMSDLDSKRRRGMFLLILTINLCMIGSR